MAIYVSNEELYSLLQSEESDILDFKSADLLLNPDSKNRYKIAKHLVGFANHQGGKLVFGVNDSREPEGENLLKEKTLGTISEIISTRISPSIEFSYEFYTEEKGDLSEGSVFVIDIQHNSSPIPYAIVERSGGEIRKREYRIRVGESTRLVSDEELLALFEDQTDVEIESSETLNFLLNDDYAPASTNYKPRYQYTFDRHFSTLRTEQESLIELIRGGSPENSDEAIGRIIDSQYALTISTILSHPEFSFITEGLMENKIGNQADEITFELTSIGPSSIIMEDDSNPLIEETDMEKLGIHPGHDSNLDYFKIPETAKVHVQEDFRGFDICNEHFNLSISVDLVEVGVGFPTLHPESVPEPGEYGLKSKSTSNATMHSHVSIESEFEYPDQTYEEFESYRAYCESLVEIFEDSFDFDDYRDQLPEPKMLTIEDKIDDLSEKVKELSETDSG